MAKRGMGAVYVRTSDGDLLRMEGNIPERLRLIEEYYHPHHRRLTEAVQATLDHWGSCLIIDAHSFSSVPLPHEWAQAPDRPDICIGTDDFHTPKPLVAQAVELFENAGYRTQINRPFSGALVPEKFYGRDARVVALMIEVNRKIYMDEASGERLPSFAAFQSRLQVPLSQLICGFAKGWPAAAASSAATIVHGAQPSNRLLT